MTREINLPELDVRQIEALLQRAIEEDIGTGDVTSNSVVPPEARARGTYISKQTGVIAGLPVLPIVFDHVDESLAFTPLVPEGSVVRPGKELAQVEGSAISILSAERISLNFLQRLSGIATLAAMYVEKVRGTDVKVLDTRKTTPGWRYLEKYAVRQGGATNHRIGLYDQVLIKDNHLELSGHQPITEAVRKARENSPPGMRIEVEIESLDHIEEAIEAGADIIMLDNMAAGEVARGVKMIRSKAKKQPIIEASGNVTLETVAAIAKTGVDWISAGELTHSARSLDISLILEPIDDQQ